MGFLGSSWFLPTGVLACHCDPWVWLRPRRRIQHEEVAFCVGFSDRVKTWQDTIGLPGKPPGMFYYNHVLTWQRDDCWQGVIPHVPKNLFWGGERADQARLYWSGIGAARKDHIDSTPLSLCQFQPPAGSGAVAMMGSRHQTADTLFSSPR